MLQASYSIPGSGGVPGLNAGTVSFDIASSALTPPIIAIRALDIPDGGDVAVLPAEQIAGGWRVRVLLGLAGTASGTLRIVAFEPLLTGLQPVGDGGIELYNESGELTFTSAYPSLRVVRSAPFSAGKASLSGFQSDSFVAASCYPKNLQAVVPTPPSLYRYHFRYETLRRSGSTIQEGSMLYSILVPATPPALIPPEIRMTGYLMEIKHPVS